MIDPGLLPADLPWGELSALAGEGAYQYVRAQGIGVVVVATPQVQDGSLPESRTQLNA